MIDMGLVRMILLRSIRKNSANQVFLQQIIVHNQRVDIFPTNDAKNKYCSTLPYATSHCLRSWTYLNQLALGLK